MTGPTSTTKPKSQATDDQPDHQQEDRERGGREQAGSALPGDHDGELHELARTQDDVAQRARRLVAGELVVSGTEGHDERRRADQLLASARTGLLAELREQEQERARRQLDAAARSGQDAVAGVVQGITTIVRGFVPAAFVRPEEVIEATFALADQGLRVGRRMALTMTDGVRSLSLAA